MYDLHKLGGTPMLLKYLRDSGLLDDSCITVTGKTHRENWATAPDVPTDQDLIVPLDRPLKPHADIQICFGNLAPDGIVFKVSSLKDSQFRGTAICFEEAKAVVDAVEAKQIQPGSVIVLRNLGPVACGMPEVLVATAALAVPELDGKVAFISDTRVSGVSHGAIGVHCAPEAAVGGPIGLVENGDEISVDLLAGELTLHVSEETMMVRSSAWTAPARESMPGYLADFCATSAQANFGCVSRVYHT
jgi:dihydroxy-acid dehydratase